MSLCRSDVTSSRSDTVAISAAAPGRGRSILLVRPRGDLVPRAPELRVQVLLDQAPEQLDRRPLRPDDLVPDDPRDDLVVAEAPDRDPLVPLRERLGELVQVLGLAATHIEIDDRKIGLAAPGA